MRGGGVYTPFKQKEEWKLKRLESLKTSEAWKERNKRHSEIMTKIHAEGKIKIGVKTFTKEQQKEYHERSMEKIRKPVCSKDDEGNILNTFSSIKEAAEFYKIKDSTHIVRVCKGKSKSGKTYGIRFEYKN